MQDGALSGARGGAAVPVVPVPRWQRQHGDIIGAWLLQILAFLGVLALIGYEVISLVVTNVALDDTAREVARATRDAYRVDGSLEQAGERAADVAAVDGAEVLSVTEDGSQLVVELRKQAPTLLVHRIRPLEDLTIVDRTARVSQAS